MAASISSSRRWRAGFWQGALTSGGEAIAARRGVIRTNGVTEPTTHCFRRIRYLLAQPDRETLRSQEVIATGRAGGERLADDRAGSLPLAVPTQNNPVTEMRKRIANALEHWHCRDAAIHALWTARGTALEDRHRRIRQSLYDRSRDDPQWERLKLASDLSAAAFFRRSRRGTRSSPMPRWRSRAKPSSRTCNSSRSERR